MEVLPWGCTFSQSLNTSSPASSSSSNFKPFGRTVVSVLSLPRLHVYACLRGLCCSLDGQFGNSQTGSRLWLIAIGSAQCAKEIIGSCFIDHYTECWEGKDMYNPEMPEGRWRMIEQVQQLNLPQGPLYAFKPAPA